MRIINTTFISAFFQFHTWVTVIWSKFLFVFQSNIVPLLHFLLSLELMKMWIKFLTWVLYHLLKFDIQHYHVRIILTFNSFTDERVHKTDKRQSSVVGITFIIYYALRFGDHLFSTKKEDRHMSRMVYFCSLSLVLRENIRNK